MANTYLHGTYGEVGKTQAISATQAGTTPVYLGTAPVNLIRGYADAGIIGRPIKLTNWKQACATIGYSNDWQTFTLCEAVKAHFDNTLGNIGPIYVIPCMATTPATEERELSLTPVNGRAEFASDKVILDSLTIEGMDEGVDYSIDYDFTTAKVIIKLADKTHTDALALTYDEFSGAIAEASDIVGGKTAGGEYSGIGAIELLYNNENAVGTLFAAPGWSHYPEVHAALVSACQKMNGKWYGYCYTDIPLEDASTIAAAIAYKREHGMTSQYETVCWPKGIDATGKVFHGSTLSMWCQQRVDFSHDSVPFETASNKPVAVLRQYFGENSRNMGYDKQTANELNEAGIRTLVPEAGEIVLWGGHTGAYQYGATSDAVEIFDTNVRMLGHVINSFHREWGYRIDEPMKTQLKDEIVNREQDKLNALKAQGALIGSPIVSFLPSENSTTDMINGDFKFDHLITPTPQLKSATVTVSYTDAGFSVFTQSA